MAAAGAVSSMVQARLQLQQHTALHSAAAGDPHAAPPFARADPQGKPDNPIILDIQGLRAKICTTGQEVLTGVNLTLREGACACVRLFVGVRALVWGAGLRALHPRLGGLEGASAPGAAGAARTHDAFVHGRSAVVLQRAAAGGRLRSIVA